MKFFCIRVELERSSNEDDSINEFDCSPSSDLFLPNLYGKSDSVSNLDVIKSYLTTILLLPGHDDKGCSQQEGKEEYDPRYYKILRSDFILATAILNLTSN